MWWIGGVPLVLVMAVLSGRAEELFLSGSAGWANLAALLRFALYFAWFLVAWNCARNVGHQAWTYLARGTLGAGLLATILT